MAKKLFSNLLDQAKRRGFKKNSSGARAWLRNKAKSFDLRKRNLTRATARFSGRPEIGKMYFFMYDPKHKDKLPYYDVFPLVIVADGAKDGFYGLNFHYLPHRQRAILMDALYDVISDDNYDRNTKLKISYNLLKSASKYKQFKPTFKRYLFSKMGSKLIEIESSEWDIAMMLPLEDFKKSSNSKVWKDSLGKI